MHLAGCCFLLDLLALSRYISSSSYISLLFLMASEIVIYETERAVGHVLVDVSLLPLFTFFFFYIQISFEPLGHADLLLGFGYSMYMISGFYENCRFVSFCFCQLLADECAWFGDVYVCVSLRV